MPGNHADSRRIEFRLQPEDKAVLARAAAMGRADPNSFILRAALSRANETIAEAETLKPSERDSLRMLDLLANPPAATISRRRCGR
jgi:uncharacterized protein (DUF1778 family)